MIELYEITYKGLTYYYISGNKRKTIDGHVYVPIGIERTEITKELIMQDVKIKAFVNKYPFTIFKSGLIVDEFSIVVKPYTFDYGGYKGVLSDYSVDYSKETVTMTFISRFMIQDSQVPNRTFSKICPYMFGSLECGVPNQQDVNFSGTIYLRDNGFTIQPIGLSSGYSVGRKITTNYGEVAYITSVAIVSPSEPYIHLSAKFTIAPTSIVISSDINIGCDKSMEMCQNTYNNIERFGGFPFTPAKNPAKFF